MYKIYLLLVLVINIYALSFPQQKCDGVGEIKYTTSIYTGECKNDKKDGRGRLVFNDGSKYEGEFVDNEKNGHGTQYYKDGSIYTGEWKNSLYHGDGVLKLNSGDSYSGNWVSGKKEGNGTYKYASKSVYSGSWLDDRKHGYGELQLADGAIYKGEFVKDLKTGKGLYIYSSGATYDGEWLNGQKHGHGKYIDSDGNIYDGSWSNNKKDGKGILTHKSGESYNGDWKNDQKDGFGVLSFESGWSYKGLWKNDMQNGEGEIIDQYGKCSGIWEENKLISLNDEYTKEDEYKQFNKFRLDAGMIELRINPILENSAKNHSRYIQKHYNSMKGMDFHLENSSKDGFSGENAASRAIKSGYFSRAIGEGISNYCSAQASINALMTGIYHRFEILAFDKDEFGIGFTQDSNVVNRNFVHNTGNSNLNILCQGDSSWFGDYYKEVCANKELKIKVDPYTNAKNKIAEMNPRYVVWPVDGSVDNLYTYKDELPSPLSDFKQTGNPVSVEFNPYFFPSKIVVHSFKLFNKYEEIVDTKLLTMQTDTNKLLTQNQYALFPLKPLQRDTEYKAVIQYKYDGVSSEITSTFRTKK